jgi:hypothetical protein
MKKAISKINEELFKVLSTIEELTENEKSKDFNTREGKICANIKVYDWFDKDDLESVLKDKQLTPYQKSLVTEEFDENRLSSIYNHVCEDQVNCLKEQYEDSCDLSNWGAIFRVYNKANNKEGHEKAFYIERFKEDSWYIERYWETAKQFKTFEEYQKSVTKNDEIGYNEWIKRSYVNKFECWQYGRSGGWFSICDKSEVEFEANNYDTLNLVYDLRQAYNDNDNKAFNEVLNNYSIDDKKKYIKECEEEVKEYNDKVHAIESIIEDIENSKKYFKETLLNELEHEVQQFINHEMDSNEIQSNCTIQIEQDIVKTSKGVTVLKDEFQSNLELLKPLFNSMHVNDIIRIDKKVGNYFVEYATKVENDTIIKAGCHKFSLNNILQLF